MTTDAADIVEPEHELEPECITGGDDSAEVQSDNKQVAITDNPLTVEYNYIDAKIEEFGVYQGRPEFQDLPREERIDCYDQMYHMRFYRTQLKLRLGMLKHK